MSSLVGHINEVRGRADADRPSPAIPLLLLGLVVAGALVLALVRRATAQVVAVEPVSVSASGPAGPPTAGSMQLLDGSLYFPFDDGVRLVYWVSASIVAYLLAIWIARRQGYRHGVWVDRLPLAMGGVGALIVSAVIVLGRYGPGDLLLRGNLPLIAIVVGVILWAIRERRPDLWVLAAVLLALTLLANLYNMENPVFRVGVPVFGDADEIADLGSVAAVLLIAAAIFGVRRRRLARTLGIDGAR